LYYVIVFGLILVLSIVVYIKIFTVLFGPAIFIFNQFRAYLDDAQLEEFYRTILDEKIPVMLMEGREYDKIKGESWFIIDKDLCQIF
ncbi:type II-A CRISPR-associated protein Csn2, partial [Allisonella histaminiformans]|uniref:type II-A CRISPR-associated protein Csn2 n=1 Tax=Allisonella histaminiformans TaxID=209880 RepID=UPI00307B1965